MVNCQAQRQFTQKWEQDQLKLLTQLTKSFRCPVSEYQLRRLISKTSSIHFANNTVEMNYHDHFIFMWNSAAEVKSFAFELEYTISIGLQKWGIVH